MQRQIILGLGAAGSAASMAPCVGGAQELSAAPYAAVPPEPAENDETYSLNSATTWPSASVRADALAKLGRTLASVDRSSRLQSHCQRSDRQPSKRYGTWTRAQAVDDTGPAGLVGGERRDDRPEWRLAVPKPSCPPRRDGRSQTSVGRASYGARRGRRTRCRGGGDPRRGPPSRSAAPRVVRPRRSVGSASIPLATYARAAELGLVMRDW